MVDLERFEANLVVALDRYADEAPARRDLDVLVEAVSTQPQRRGLSARVAGIATVLVPARPAFRLAWLLLLLALVASIVAGIAVTGGWFRERGLSFVPDPSALPQRTPPPMSTATWTSLDLQRLPDGPPGGAFLVSWSGGYLALAEVVTPGYEENGPRDGGPLYGWTSVDGRTWRVLPDGTFGSGNFGFGAAPLADGVIVITHPATGDTRAWRSSDAGTWTSSTAPGLRLTGGLYPFPPSEVEDSEVAGGPGGVVAIPQQNVEPSSASDSVAFSADGTTWQIARLPGEGAAISGLAAFGSGFVAVGSVGIDAIHPAAWWSDDGLHWAQTLDATGKPGEGFEFIRAGRDGLIANSWSGPIRKARSWWTSPNGRSWSLAKDPLGGTTGDGGWFEGDGTRLLWFPVPMTDYWTSFDGRSWTKLGLTGDVAHATAGKLAPFVMRDGILLVNDVGPPWFAGAAK